MFEATDVNQRQKRIEGLVRTLFLLMTVLLVLPVLLILAILVWRGGPMISWEFLFSEPTQGMTAGGIFPALVGTIWLVSVALLASVPRVGCCVPICTTAARQPFGSDLIRPAVIRFTAKWIVWQTW